jgi:hypothetical protein
MPRHQNADQQHDIQIIWKYGTVQVFRRTVTIENLNQDEIKRRLNPGNACYHSVQSFCLPICCLEAYKLEYMRLIFPVIW